MNGMQQYDETDRATEGAKPLQGDGVRGIPNLKPTRRKANVNKLWIVLVVFAVLAIGAGSLAIFVKRLTDHHEQQREEARNAPKDSGTSDSGHDFGVDKDRLAREKADANLRAAALALPTPAGAQAPGGGQQAVPVLPAVSGSPGTGAVAVSPAGGGSYGLGASLASSATHPQTPAERRLQGDVLISTSSGPVAGMNASHNSTAVAGTANTAAAGSAHGSLDSQLAPSTLASVTASRLPDLDYLLKRGTNIRCGQKTKIVTTYPGMISCIVTRDVYSADGHTLLIERGSEATGEQRTALMQGQARIFTLWSRIDMPNGITINLDSPGADSLGASGLDAYVDPHFWERFGGALMLSVVGDVGQALSNLTIGKGSHQIQLSNTSSSTQDLAAETLKNTINIPPTAYSNQGSEINIFVARDVDFRSVYELVSQ